MRREQSGFTLIELMIVVGIIGILAAIAIPRYQEAIARAQFAESASMLSGVRAEVQRRALTGGTLSADPQQMAVELGMSLNGRYGVITATSGWNGSEDDIWIEYTFGADTADGESRSSNPQLEGERVQYVYGATGEGDVPREQWVCRTSAPSQIAGDCESSL